ncbi:MAG: VIT domain-containing protein [Sedimentisphaeraceae bacterium JB056]
MKTEKKNNIITAAAAVLLVGISQVFAAGLLKPADPSQQDSIFIKSHKVNVVINNGFAKTEVDQIFGNDGDTDLRAQYTFPLPKQASLSELSLWIDGNEVIGEVLEKERAKKIHKQQIEQGNDTALAEKNDFKTFEVSVYPVRAGADTRVRLVYYQPLSIDLNIGRYVYPLAEGGVDEERIAFWSVDDKVREHFSFDLELKSAFPIKDVRAASHVSQAVITQDSNEETGSTDNYHVTIDSPQGDALTRDVVIYYRLDDSVPARVELVPYKKDSKSTGTFMAVITPAADLQRISEGVDWCFVLDKSGSMGGGKIATLADGVSKVIGKMKPNDRFRIITFNNSAHDFTNGYINATPENVQSILNKIKTVTADGGTNLFAGLEKAYRKLDDDRTTSIILVTDGVANIGKTQHRDFINLLKKYDIRLFTFVIGNSANQPLLNKLALESDGFAMNISDSDDIVGRIIQAKAKVLFQNMHDVKLKFSGEKVTELTPERIGSLYQGQQLVIFGRYSGSGVVELEMSAKISGQQKSWKCNATFPEIDTDNPELERLWAMSKINKLMQKVRDEGENQSLRKKIVELGEEYSLTTDYTSMLVIEEAQAEELGLQKKNADRVKRERKAQENKNSQPAKNYRQDTSNGGAFNGKRSPGIGVGPVGPLFVMLSVWLKRKRNDSEN